tara:strand:- start:1949 stop:2164 length:216 start_codon:yes stop_codon:yes gene_type:complete
MNEQRFIVIIGIGPHGNAIDALVKEECFNEVPKPERYLPDQSTDVEIKGVVTLLLDECAGYSPATEYVYIS